jgi:hypothetical protein
MKSKILIAHKPRGTSSVIGGFTDGIHPVYDPNFIKELIIKERVGLLEKDLTKKEVVRAKDKLKI